MKKIFFILIMQLVALAQLQAQNKIVRGRVTDSSGPVAKASVVEKNLPTNGTTTDADGRFTLTIKGKSNFIIVSAVGFAQQQISIADNSNPEILLVRAEAKGMEDVVIVGYARQKKVTLTGAVSTVSGVQLRENPSASLQNTLAGRLPGFFSVQPTGRPGADGATFFIRGQSSYNTGSNAPLIIVDDIEYSYDQFSRIDPNEIESLSILKDASTTAVYGVKGANGVVIITTRRGKIGPPKISTRLETSLQQPTKIPKYLDAFETATLYNQAQINDNKINPVTGFTPRFSQADLDHFKSGDDPYGHPNVDWYSELFKKFSKQYRANFDISGGTEKVKYFISLGGLYQDGMVKNFSKSQDVNGNYYNMRYNYRSNLDIKVTKTTDVRVDLYGNIGEINTPNVGSPFGYNDVFYEYSSFLSLAPFTYPIYNPNGSFGYSNWQISGGGTSSSYNVNNIVGRLTYYGYNRNYENNMNFITSANQKLDFITRGLSFKATAAYTSNYGYSKSMTRDQFPSFIYNPVTNVYTPRDPNVYRIRRFFSGYSAGSTVRTINIQAMLNYDRTFGKHRVYGLALLNQNTDLRFNSNSTYNFIPNNFRGFTGRAGYNFKEKYLAEIDVAYNGSDRFAKANRFGLFPAASVGWNIAKEDFIADHFKQLDNLKLRASYGLVGNDKIGSSFNYYYLPSWSNSGSINFGTSSNTFTGIREGTLGNDQVSWEKEKKLDIGIDFGLFNNRLTGTVDYFKNQRYDILTTRGTVSAVFGQTLPPVNLGIVDNQGYEIEINYNGKIGKELSYNVKGTYSVAKNKINFADEPTYANKYQAFTGNSIGMQRVYRFIGYYKDSADIANSPQPSQKPYPGDLKYADLNGDGKIDGFDQEVTGYSNIPNTTYGFQVGFRYKGFSLSAFFQGAMNFNVRAVAEAIRPFSSNLTAIHQYAWTPELGDNAKFPRLSMVAGASDAISYPSTFYFISGNYLRLKTAEIGYSLPEKWLKHVKLENVKFYANAYNLFTWTKLDKLYDFDPEISTNTDRTIYPPQRIINFGTSITF
ncbi:SusC/RagA family TonB-linked outer membrane protein [Ferruginibacter profundus]